MDIIELLEGKFVDTEYAYHATKGEHLPSILKHGLVPNKESASGYGSDVNSVVGYNMSALPGVYFTRRDDSAKNIASELAGNNRLIVVAQIQPRSATLDEDDIASDFAKENSFARGLRRQFPKGFNEQELRQAVEAHAETIFAGPHLKNMDPRAVQNVRPALTEYLMEIGQFIHRSNSGDFTNQSDIKRLQLILTKKFRHFASKSPMYDDGRPDTFKIDKPVGFSGANKIVGLYCPDTRLGWGDIGDYTREAYHIFKNPRDIFKRYDEN